MKRIWQNRLGREITLVLLVKLALIVAIKLIYFSDAEKPASEDVAKALLSVPQTIPSRGEPPHD